MNEYFTVDFDLVCDLSVQGRYDYVIAGSGVGGGVLASELVKAGKRILLVEKGGVPFTTHCLNTSRPRWQIGGTQGPSQDNDVVYNAVKKQLQVAHGSDQYVGGPVYGLGGRSTVWGLFSPKIDVDTLRKYFPESIYEYLKVSDPQPNGYERALQLFTNDSQTWNSLYPIDSMDPGEHPALVAKLKEAIQSVIPQPVSVETAPMAAEFQSRSRYVLSKGAYSTVDALLDLVFARNNLLTTLTNTEVLRLHDDGQGKASYLTVRSTTSARCGRIYAKEAIILCAGTIGTAKIALNSGLQNSNPIVGRGLTDHEIWGVRVVNQAKSREPLKLQALINICNAPALLNVTINGDSFLGSHSGNFPNTQCWKDHRLVTPGEIDDSEADTLTIVLQYGAELEDGSQVLDLPTQEPVV